MPKNIKKKHNEHKRSKILTEDESFEEEMNNYKTKKRHYKPLIESHKVREETNILTVSEFEYVNSVVKSKTTTYDIVKNEDITLKGVQGLKDKEEEDKWEWFIDMLMLFEGCKVDITKVIKLTEESQDKSNNNNKSSHNSIEEEEYKIDITIDTIASFSLLANKLKDYVNYSPITINVSLSEEDKIFQNELEIPKGDIIKLINIFLEYKKNRTSSI